VSRKRVGAIHARDGYEIRTPNAVTGPRFAHWATAGAPVGRALIDAPDGTKARFGRAIYDIDAPTVRSLNAPVAEE
jgi:hypothetical protein